MTVSELTLLTIADSASAEYCSTFQCPCVSLRFMKLFHKIPFFFFWGLARGVGHIVITISLALLCVWGLALFNPSPPNLFSTFLILSRDWMMSQRHNSLGLFWLVTFQYFIGGSKMPNFGQVFLQCAAILRCGNLQILSCPISPRSRAQFQPILIFCHSQILCLL